LTRPAGGTTLAGGSTTPSPAQRSEVPGAVNVTVLGGGNGGCATAADLMRRGIPCTLFDLPEFAAVLEPIRAAGEMHLTGALGTATVPAPRVTTDIGEAARDADVLVLAVPAFAVRTFAAAAAPFLRAGQVVVLTPGSTGGALAFADVLDRQGGSRGVIVAETLSLPYACRKTSPTEVHVAGMKRQLPVAAYPAAGTATAVEVLGHVFPGLLVAATHVLETSLNNPNAMAHPVPAVLNAGWIETTGGDFRFYTDGVSPSVGRVMDALDRDRLGILTALGLDPVPAIEWDRRFYGLAGANSFEVNRDSEVHSGIRAPAMLASRYLLEDVPYGLVPLASIARELGVATPVIDLVIDLASTLLGQDLREQGWTAASLGLAGLDARGMVERVTSGGG
jgi:opine dehydrogenase